MAQIHRIALIVASVALVGCARKAPPETPATAPSPPLVQLAAEGAPAPPEASPSPPPAVEAPPPQRWLPPAAQARPPEVQARIEAAVAARSEPPRTRHKAPDGPPLYANRLAMEKSPYLLQHAHNPVDWRPWGDEAFEDARRLGRPVLLSIGYATCHWCHVMEEESFEDPEISATINTRYIAIKVDREERPDVDAVYMQAVQLLTRRGGWPMTVWLTPDRQPFMAGTYFPARDGDRGSRKGFLTLLRELADQYTADPTGSAARAQELASRVAQSMGPAGAAADLPPYGAISSTVDSFWGMFDTTSAGFGSGQRFPRPVVLELLLRHWRRTGDERSKRMVTETIDAMVRGGLHDHVDGGFHRYTVDPRWTVPHFEKMLYDNTQLVMLLLDAARALDRPDWVDAARGALEWMDRDMTVGDGGFASATDADSEGEEGLFAVWTPAQVRAAVGELAPLAEARWGVTERGNFEHGATVLFVAASTDELARRFSLSPDEVVQQLGAARARLFAARRKRPQPLRDDKAIAAWNGLAISAFARAGRLLADPALVERARRAARFALERLVKGDRVLRRWRDGEAQHQGVLEDVTFLVAGLLDLYEADGDPAWLGRAIALQRSVDTHFRAPNGGWYRTADDAEALIARELPDYDGAEPSGVSVGALNLLRLAALTADDAWRARVDEVLRANATQMQRGGPAVPLLLCALDWRLDRPLEVVVVSPPGTPADALLAVDAAVYHPNRVLVPPSKDPATLATLVPPARDKPSLDGKPTAYVCEQGVCQRPTTEPAVLRASLGVVEPAPEAPPPR